MSRLVVISAGIIVVFAALFLIFRGRMLSNHETSSYVSQTRTIMATPITVVVPENRAERAADIVFGIFNEIDVAMSEWKPDSPLTAVNEAAGERAVEVPNELRRVIKRGIELGELTDGAFDITWAALWGLWDFKAETPVLPSSDEIEQRLGLVDYTKIIIDDESSTVFLPRKGMLIGLGGIAKGTALQRAADALKAEGFDSFLLSAGGHVILHGRRVDRPWRVGIRDPRGALDDYFTKLELTDTSISTSGDYERYFILDGVRYHHILDPRTGYPARGGLRSATVVCADAELADAISTAMMIMGRDKAMALAEGMPEVETVLVDEQGVVHVSGGLEGRLEIDHPPIK